jgi:hypothetical protein
MAGKKLQEKTIIIISEVIFNHDKCTAVALCISNILDVMVLENKYYLKILNINMVGNNTSVQLMPHDVTM